MTVSGYFLPTVFYNNSNPSGPLVHLLKYFLHMVSIWHVQKTPRYECVSDTGEPSKPYSKILQDANQGRDGLAE